MPNQDGVPTDVQQNTLTPVAPSQVSHVAVKIPPLWKSKIKLWFLQVESNFAIANVIRDETKYHHLVSSIDPDTLSSVSDILLNPPISGKYDALKTRLIAEFSASENEQIRQLISELHLGDDKPSHLLRKMRELGGKNVNDELLKTLWFQRLPSEIQTILSISSESLDNLARMADKISEVRNPVSDTGVFAIGRTATSSNHRIDSSSEISALRNEIATLSKQVQRLSRSRSKSPFNRYRDIKKRGCSRDKSREHNEGYCYYHKHFGKNARKCRDPCTYQSENDQEN